MNAEKFAVPATTGLVKWWCLSMTLLLGTMLVLPAPVMGQAVNATLLGTVTDTSGGVVAGVEVSVDGGMTWHPATGPRRGAASF